MRLNSQKLKQAAQSAGVGVEELAAAVERTGLSGQQAEKAVRNWMAGRDHPRCKAADLARMAGVLGVQVKDIARFVSQVRYHRGSTRKARLVADMIRGKRFDQAEQILRFSPKRASENMQKCLAAAFAEAEEFEANDPSRLVVAEIHVEEGPQIKRFRPKDRGRAHPILKQTSHITIGLEERA